MGFSNSYHFDCTFIGRIILYDKIWLCNIRLFPTSIRVVRGHFDELEDQQSIDEKSVFIVERNIVDTIKYESIDGEVNHFQALATAVSGTVGPGNIAMVAVAISLGGPSATFWIIVAGDDTM